MPFYIIFYSYILANVCFLPAVSSGIEEEKAVVPSVPFGSHNIEGSFKDGIHEGFLSELNEDEKKSCVKRLLIFDMSCETAVDTKLLNQPPWQRKLVAWWQAVRKKIGQGSADEEHIKKSTEVSYAGRLTMREHVVCNKQSYHSSLMISGIASKVRCSFVQDRKGLHRTLVYSKDDSCLEGQKVENALLPKRPYTFVFA